VSASVAARFKDGKRHPDTTEDVLEEIASSIDHHPFALMLSLEMDVALVKSEWRFCDRITEYLSDILGQGQSDPARYSNFLSVAANELVELAFRWSGQSGLMSFSLHRNATTNRLTIELPYQDMSGGRHTETRLIEARPDLVVEAGEGKVSTASTTALLEDLATIFRTAIRIETDGVRSTKIVADFPLAEDFR